MDSDKQTRSTCGVPDLRQQLVRRCVRQWTVADGDVMVRRRRSIAEDWRRAGDDGPNAQRRDQHDTRRHPATSMSSQDGDSGTARGLR